MHLLVAGILGLSLVWAVLAIFAPDDKADLRRPLFAALPLLGLGLIAALYAVQANRYVLDRYVYTNELSAISTTDIAGALNLTLSTRAEPLYVVWMWFVSRGGVGTEWLYLCIGITVYATSVVALRMLLPLWYVPLFWLVTLSLGFLPSYMSIAVRQGVALALFLGGICALVAGRRWFLSGAFFAGAILFHWSAIAAVAAVLAARYLRVSMRGWSLAWLVAAVLYVGGLQERLIGGLSSFVPELVGYTSVGLSSAYQGGTNRVDFLVFSAVILAVGLWGLGQPSAPTWYPQFLKAYIALNVLFLMFGFIFYSDRIGSYSWLLAPVLFLSPWVNGERLHTRQVAAYALLASAVYGVLIGPVQELLELSVP